MRKLLTLSLFILMGINSFGQSWLDVGIKGSWGLNFLYHKNVLDDPDMDERFTGGFNVGGKLGWNFNDFHEVTVDVLFYKFSQNYRYRITDSLLGPGEHEFSRGISMTGLQLCLLYRHNNDGRYVEIGPNYSTVSSVSMTDEQYSTSGYDFKQHVNSGQMGLTFGFGGYFVGTENFGITMGVRFNYAIGDAFKDDGFNIPAFKTYDAYTAGHPLSVMLVLEANLDFAFMAKAKCSNKRKLILF